MPTRCLPRVGGALARGGIISGFGLRGFDDVPQKLKGNSTCGSEDELWVLLWGSLSLMRHIVFWDSYLGPPVCETTRFQTPVQAAVEQFPFIHVGGCQNYGAFWGPYYSTTPNI